MTIMNRSKNCLTCKMQFFESKGDSHKQWKSREYCSQKCNSKSESRVTSIFDRLERYQVKNADGCWSWSGTKDGKGYGVLSHRKGHGFSPEKAHRVSYEKEYGLIPKGQNICHKCDAPECTNPKHLFSGSQKENMQDCSKKGRLNHKSLLNLRPGECGILGAGTKSNKELKRGFSK